MPCREGMLGKGKGQKDLRCGLLRGSRPAGGTGLITETNRTLPLYKRMSAVEFSAQPLPRNAMGKLMR